MVDDQDIARLRTVVAAYGSRPARWPKQERAALEPVARACDGATWMTEAKILDELLDAVPGAAMRTGLADDIVAEALTVARADPLRIVSLQAAARKPRLTPGLAARAGQAAFLAASLVAGFWLGATNQIETLANGAPLGLSELVPGVSDESSLSVLWWDAVENDMGLP
jgi:hypothetical protein